MFETYIPGFTNMLMRPDLLEGGPAYVDMMPGLASLPAEEPVPYANPFTPQGDFLERIRQAEAMSQAEAPVYTPDMGALNMLMRPDLFGGGPAYADMMPAAMPEQVSMLPFAPEAPAPQPMQPPMPSGLGGRQDFMDARDIYMGDAPDRFSLAASNTLANAPQRDPVTGLLLNAQGQQGFQFMTDRGRQAGFGSGNTGFLTADPNAQYRMFDERGKNRVVAEGTGVDALQNIYNLANQFNTEQGKKANWGIERLNPTTGRWERVAENDPAKGLGIVGDIIGGALPLAALAIPGFGKLALAAKLGIGAGLGGVGAGIAGNDPLKGAVMGGLSMAGGQVLGPALGKGLNIGSQAAGAIGTGIGATTGGLATGQSLENALIGGALAGAGSFGAGKIASQLGAPNTGPTGKGGGGFDASNITVMPQTTVSFTPPAISDQTSRILDKQVAAEPVITNDGMVLTGQKLGALGQMTSGAPGLGNIFSPSAFAPSPPSDVQGDAIEVLRNKDLDTAANMYARLGMETPQEVLDAFRQETPVENEIVVTKKPEVPSISVTAPLPYTPTITGPPSADPNEIVVTDTKKPVPPAPSISLTPPVIGTQPADTGEIVVTDTKKPFDMSAPLPPLSAVPTTAGGEFGDKQVAEQKKKPITVEDIQKYLKAAGLLSALLPGGGGGRGALNRIPAGFGSGFGSGFGGSLPRATLPGAATGFAQRALAPQDYYRYGYGPSQSFFDYVPQGQPNTSRAFTGYEQAQAREGEGFYLGGMAGGGYMADAPRDSFAVNGPGTGRSDEIPAMLSDGEYVMDAEFVALLGDGSPKAGADILDQFRINVRKDKGRNLAKGKFSTNAKRPEHYLKGGRT